MQLQEIYSPIKKELNKVESVLSSSLSKTKSKALLKVTNYLLSSSGKRLRPALLILCAKAAAGNEPKNHKPDNKLAKIAAALELIHMSSLIHDDVIDKARLRHNKPTINHKWNQDVSIALGDYLYSIAFELVSSVGNTDILQCISSATKAMCEGELHQVCERKNLRLLKKDYFIIIKKKTAGLFAASCQAGGMISDASSFFQNALYGYGLNFGIAFQIIDDHLDIVSSAKDIGKTPGQDIRANELTLPLLNLFECVDVRERKELQLMLANGKEKRVVEKIKFRLSSSGAVEKTRQETLFYVNLAKQKINALSSSCYKESLFNLTDYLFDKIIL